MAVEKLFTDMDKLREFLEKTDTPPERCPFCHHKGKWSAKVLTKNGKPVHWNIHCLACGYNFEQGYRGFEALITFGSNK